MNFQFKKLSTPLLFTLAPMGVAFVLTGCGSPNANVIKNPTRAELEKIDKADEAKYGKRTKKHIKKVYINGETGQVIQDPSLIGVAEGHQPGEIVTPKEGVIKTEIIDNPPAMNVGKKSKKASVSTDDAGSVPLKPQDANVNPSGTLKSDNSPNLPAVAPVLPELNALPTTPILK